MPLSFESIVQHPALAGREQLIPDLPGYGHSPWLDEPLSLERQAEGLWSWLASRCPEPVVLIGHSMGGVIGTLMAEQQPERCAHLVNIEGNISLGDCAFSGRAEGHEREPFVETVFPTLTEGIHRAGMKDPALRGYEASLRLCDPGAFYMNALELVRLSTPEDLAQRQAQLDLPNLYIAGCPQGVCPRSLELLVRARVQTLELSPSGHWPFIDQPEAFARGLARALEL